MDKEKLTIWWNHPHIIKQTAMRKKDLAVTPSKLTLSAYYANDLPAWWEQHEGHQPSPKA